MSCYHTYTPPPPLAAFVETFWLYESGATTDGRERRLPSGSVDLVVNLCQDTLRVYDPQSANRCQNFSGGVVSGAHSSFFVIDTACLTSVIGISFKPGGAFPFFPLPIDQLYNSHVPLEMLWGSAAGELRERLLALRGPQARLRALAQFLLRQATRPLLQSPLVTYSLAELQTPAPGCTVTAITEQIGFSARHFNQLFSAVVGLTPKRFYRVRRFQETLRLLEQHEPISWAEIAAACGYFDQAHFIHDFRAFSGLTPGVYFTHRSEFRNHVPLIT